MAKFYVVKGKRRKGFRTRRGAAWHKRHFGGRVVAGKKRGAKKRRSPKRRRKTSRRRR